MSGWLEAALLTRPPRLLRPLLPGTEWDQSTPAPTVFLTFDDGPIPDETPWVLEQLARFRAPATFFCVGENLARYPEIARAALAAGHRLANHTQHHCNAWATGRAHYLQDVAECQAVLEDLAADKFNFLNSLQAEANNQQLTTNNPKHLFRPPYGRLTWPLLRTLQANYRVIMWSVLTRDYDPTLRPEACLRLALAAVRSGDIVVFHDSHKASARLRYVLPRLLAHLAEQGFCFKAL